MTVSFAFVARVNRGGSFGSGAGDQRSASRAGNPPAEASAYRGFRLALAYQAVGNGFRSAN